MTEHSAERAFNIIDSIIVDDAIRNGMANGGLEKARTEILKVYNGRGSSNDEYGESSYDSREPRPIQYAEETEDGFVGLEPPMN